MIDAEHIFVSVYDPVKKALRIKGGLGPVASTALLDWEHIIQASYDAGSNALRIQGLGAASGSFNTQRDFAQALKLAFNTSTSELKITTV